MTMIKDTIAYLKKSFGVLILGALLPSIIISFFARPISSLTSLPILFLGSTDYKFTEIFMHFLTPISNAGFWSAFLGYIVFFVFLWAGIVVNVSIADKHMKTGELSLKLSKHQVFPYVFSILLALVIWSIIYLITMVSQSGLISLIHYICGVTPPTLVDCLLSVAVSILLFFALMYFSLYLVFVPLIMVCYGYGFRESLVESIRLTTKNFKQLFAGLLLPVLVILIGSLCLYLVTSLLSVKLSDAAYYWMDYAISVIAHSLIIIYLTSYALVAFYNLANLERRDKKWYEKRR